jgi:hypothetical protein
MPRTALFVTTVPFEPPSYSTIPVVSLKNRLPVIVVPVASP